MVFLCLFPVFSAMVSCVIGNSMNRVVMQEQDKLPQNAEFLDFEDDESDILRKATIATVKKRITL